MSTAPVNRRLRAAAAAVAVTALGAAVLAAPGPAAAAQGAWAEAQTLSGPTPEQARVDTGADGTTAVTWEGCVDGDCRVEAAVRAPGAALFGPKSRVSPVHPGGDGVEGHDIDDSDVAVLPDGSVVVVWSVYTWRTGGDYDYTVQTSTRAAGTSTWSTPDVLHDDPDYPEDLVVVAGADDTAAISWTTWGDATVHVATRKGPTGVWSATPVAAEDHDVYSSTVAVGPSGEVVVAWSSGPSSNVAELRYRVRAAGATTWGTVTPVRPDLRGTGLRLGVSAAGTFHLLWTARGTDPYDFVRTSSLAGVTTGWTEPDTLTLNYDVGAELAVGADGTVGALWLDDDDSVQVVVRRGGSWGAVATLGSTPWDPSIAVGDDGTVTVVWRVSAPHRVLARTLEPGTTAWTDEAELVEHGGIEGPVVAVGADGRATAAWTATAGAFAASTPPVPPTVQPSLRGTFRTGETVTCVPGVVGATDPTVAWLRGGAPVAGATGLTHRLTPSDHGEQVACRVTATNAAGSTTATSAAVTVKAGTITLVKKPKVKGKAKVGKKLRATKGTWSVKPDKVTYRWFKGKKKVKGKVGKKKAYKVKQRDAGKKLRVKVTVKADGYAKATTKSKPKKVKRTK